MLVQHGAEMARVYNGVHSRFFSETRIRAILDNIDDLELLAESGLAVGASWADRMFETCPFPLHPERHLEVQSFRQITVEGEIEFFSQTPWLAWCEALDLICMGVWAGFGPPTITTMVQALQQKVTKLPSEPVAVNNELLGRKVNLPMFSRGLQGVVVGIFQDVPKEQFEPVLTTLTQFGETLSDVYADLRWKHFCDAIDEELDEDSLAREVINVVSPVNKLIVNARGRRAGYKIEYEYNFWSGYSPIPRDELNAPPSKLGFSVSGPDGAEIYIEPLTDIPHINPEFTRIRLENYLNRTLSSIVAVQDSNPLSFAEIRQLRVDFEAYKREGNPSLAKLRQYYVVDKVEKHWHSSAIKVTNSELKSFLERELDREVKNGYQVTSFVPDLEKIFGDKVTIAKTRNALSLSWSKSASAPANKSPNT